MYNDCNYKVFHVKHFVAAEVYGFICDYVYEEKAKTS
jgi:hypothetical protein